MTATRVVLGFQTEYFPPDVNANADLYGTLVTHLGHHLDRVDVVTARPHYGAALPREDDEKLPSNVRVLRCRAPSWRLRTNLLTRFVSELAFSARNAFAALRVSRDWDVVLASTPPMLLGIGALAVAGVRRIPLVWWVQDLHPEIACALGLASENNWKIRLLHRVHASVLRHATLTLAISDAQRRTLLAAYPGLRPDRVVVLENPASHPEAAVARDAAPDRPLVVAYTGNLGLSQGLEHVLDVADAMRDRPVRFVLHGAGVAEDDLKVAARNRHLDNVEFGQLTTDAEYVAMLRRAHVLLLCLRPDIDRYSFPSKLWTYFAAGRPVLAWAGHDGAVEETITASGAGVFAPWGDVPAAVRALEALSDANYRAKLADAASEFSARHATPEAHAKQLGDLIRTTAAAPS
jgi:glycosyltransferase involved in cell wall biosynthesis